MFRRILIVVIPFIMCNCATTYKPIDPLRLNYTSNTLDDGISLSYKYDVLHEKGNEKYSSKEASKEIKLLAVKITNNTNKTLKLGKDISFFSGENELTPMDLNVVRKEIKQNSLAYLGYLLLTPLNITITKTDGSTTKQQNYPVGAVFGPAMGLANVSTAIRANKKFSEELISYSIIGSEIYSGQTIYGIVAFKGIGFEPIRIKVKESGDSAKVQ